MLRFDQTLLRKAVPPRQLLRLVLCEVVDSLRHVNAARHVATAATVIELRHDIQGYALKVKAETLDDRLTMRATQSSDLNASTSPRPISPLPSAIGIRDAQDQNRQTLLHDVRDHIIGIPVLRGCSRTSAASPGTAPVRT